MKTETTYEYRLKQKRNSRYLKELRKKATKSELKAKEWLEKNDIHFIFQKGFLKPFHRIVDFYIPGKKIIIEIDGGYHVNTKDFDRKKDVTWAKKGYRTIRISNETAEDEYKFLTAFINRARELDMVE